MDEDCVDGNCIARPSKSKQEVGPVGDAQEHYASYQSQPEAYAKLSAEQYDKFYKMNHKERGMAIIFNHEHFKKSLNLEPRNGTNIDCERITNTLNDMGFHTVQKHNLSFNELDKKLNSVSLLDHSEYDCLVIIVLSHGDMGILYAQDVPYTADRLWNPFLFDKCPSLAGKPKIFIIQACQGNKTDAGITLYRTKFDSSMSNSYRIPVQADFLIASCTVPGYYSWRNRNKGSWFIQSLCSVLEENEKNGHNRDILTLLTFVSQRVALEYESNTPYNENMHRQKQIPCIISMLTRLLKFYNDPV